MFCRVLVLTPCVIVINEEVAFLDSLGCVEENASGTLDRDLSALDIGFVMGVVIINAIEEASEVAEGIRDDDQRDSGERRGQ